MTSMEPVDVPDDLTAYCNCWPATHGRWAAMTEEDPWVIDYWEWRDDPYRLPRSSREKKQRAAQRSLKSSLAPRMLRTCSRARCPDQQAMVLPGGAPGQKLYDEFIRDVLGIFLPICLLVGFLWSLLWKRPLLRFQILSSPLCWQ